MNSNKLLDFDDDPSTMRIRDFLERTFNHFRTEALVRIFLMTQEVVDEFFYEILLRGRMSH